MRRWSYNIGNPHSIAGEIGVLDSLAVDAVRELVSRVRRRLFVDRRWSLVLQERLVARFRVVVARGRRDCESAW